MLIHPLSFRHLSRGRARRSSLSPAASSSFPSSTAASPHPGRCQAPRGRGSRRRPPSQSEAAKRVVLGEVEAEAGCASSSPAGSAACGREAARHGMLGGSGRAGAQVAGGASLRRGPLHLALLLHPGQQVRLGRQARSGRHFLRQSTNVKTSRVISLF